MSAPNITNLLLRALPDGILQALLPRMHQVEMVHRTTLIVPNEPILAVHFPLKGYVSQVVVLEEGDSAEVGMTGVEGMAGLPLLYGDDRSPMEGLVQTPGTALRMEAGDFRAALNEWPPFRELLLRYGLAFTAQVTMTAACNSRHVVGRRLARWLLMAHDRSGSDTFPITHEFLSTMLGVRRASVSVAAGTLQRAGLIHYGRGILSVLDRPGLEAASCECHAVVRQEFKRLLG